MNASNDRPENEEWSKFLQDHGTDIELEIEGLEGEAEEVHITEIRAIAVIDGSMNSIDVDDQIVFGWACPKIIVQQLLQLWHFYADHEDEKAKAPLDWSMRQILQVLGDGLLHDNTHLPLSLAERTHKGPEGDLAPT